MIGVLLGCFVLAAFLVIVAAHRGTLVSLNDEATHADYAYQVAHGHIPARGSTIAPEILHEWSCRGAVLNIQLPPCGKTNVTPNQYPNRGEDYNFLHPPLYYAITGFIARAPDTLFAGQHFIFFGRIVGVAWLFAAMVVLYLALRRFRIGWPYALAGAVLLPLCPGVLQATSMITNDAPAVLCGAVALYLLAGLLATGKIGWIAPAIVTLLATSTKVLNALPMLLLAAVLIVIAILRARQRKSIEARSLLLSAAAIIISFFIIYKGWSIFQSGRGDPSWISPIRGQNTRPITGSPLDEWLSNTFTGFQLVSGYYLQPQLNGLTVTIWGRLLTILVASAPLLALAVFRRWTSRWALGVVTLAGMLAYPLVVELQSYFGDRTYFPVVTNRYGMTVIPLAIGCLMSVASRRRARWATLGITGAGLLVMALATAGIWSLGPP